MSAWRPALQPLEVIGSEMVTGFWDGLDPRGELTRGGVFRRREPVYATSPNARVLRDERMALRLTMGEAARLLNLSVVDVSRLERGAGVTLGSQTEWDALFATLRAGAVELGRVYDPPAPGKPLLLTKILG